jgi:hypothetical protein
MICPQKKKLIRWEKKEKEKHHVSKEKKRLEKDIIIDLITII